MLYHKRLYKLLLPATLLILTGCAPKEVPSTKGGFYYHNIYFGANLKPLYKMGIKDGCETARGNYRKSHKLFQEDDFYSVGWYLGRNKCRGLLKIDNGDNLIL